MDKVTNDFEIPCEKCGMGHGHHRAGCSNSSHERVGHRGAPHFLTQENRGVERRELHDAPALKESDAPKSIVVVEEPPVEES